MRLSCHTVVSSVCSRIVFVFFFFNATPTTEIYTLSLHDALPISRRTPTPRPRPRWPRRQVRRASSGRCTISCSGGRLRWTRSEEHTSELQSHSDLVCRLLLEKKKNKTA